MNRTLIATLTTAALLAACQSKPTSNEAYESHKHARLSQYRNVLVMCFNEGPAREAWENAIVGRPESAGRRATASHDPFPNLAEAKLTEIQAYVDGRQMEGIVAILVAGAGEIDRARAVVVGETSFHDVVAVEASAEQVTGDIQLRAVLFDCQSQTPSGWKPVWAHTSEVFAAASIGPDGVGGYVAGALDRDAEL